MFEEQTIKKLERAYRSVRQGEPPENRRIDKELWTLRDLYEHHPRGKDLSFWSELIAALRMQKDLKIPIYRGGPLPKEIYEKMVKKESEAIRKFLEEEIT